MSTKLEQLKAAFAQTKSENNYTKYYSFWKMGTNEQAIVRFLPDANQDNPRGFVVENLTHSLTINGKKRVVACLEMYDEKCPICEKSRDLYTQAKKAGEPSSDDIINNKVKPGPLTVEGKKYYRKKEYIGQVYVKSSPIEFEKNEGHEYEMPISIGPQIFKLIQASFSSGDLEENPVEFKGGYDFRIVKSDQGGQANYTLSKFVPKQSDLAEDVVAKLNLYDLSTLRNRKTGRDVMEAMLMADITGDELVLPNKANKETPSEQEEDSSQSSKSNDVPEETPSNTGGDSGNNKVNDVLAAIRARAAAKKAEST